MSKLNKFLCDIRAVLNLTNIFNNSLNLRTMTSTSLKLPPECARGMTEFDASKFDKELTVHTVEMARENVGAAMNVLSNCVLKMANLRAVLPSASGDETKKRILLDPDVVKDPKVDLAEREVEIISTLTGGVALKDVLSTEKLNLTFKNWTPKQLLDFVLEDKDKNIPTLSSFAAVGHVMHVNLKDYHLPQKEVIGRILMLYPKCRTVVNKTNSIDNTYRNFQLELLAGEEDYLVTHKELGCTYKFDFSLVYFNPRLSTEHGRVIDLLDKNDEFFDACAGVGPFAVPAAKKLTSKVYANDLNPESFKWLCENARINKVDSKMSCHNMDARQFIREVVKPHLLTTKSDNPGKVHVAMNLPAIATEFLDVFKGLLVGENVENIRRPTVHVYAFADESEEAKEDVKKRCCKSMDASGDTDIQVFYVRNVSPKAAMYRATFQVPIEVLTATESQEIEPDAKKAKVES